MSLIRETNNKGNIIRAYDHNHFDTKNDAAKWLSDIRNINGITTKYICYSDAINRLDDGLDDIKLDAQASLDVLLTEIQRENIDFISLIGNYKDKPVVIGTDLVTNIAYLTVREKDSADTKELEVILDLV